MTEHLYIYQETLIAGTNGNTGQINLQNHAFDVIKKSNPEVEKMVSK